MGIGLICAENFDLCILKEVISISFINFNTQITLHSTLASQVNIDLHSVLDP